MAMSLPRPVRMTRRRDFEAVRLRGVSVGGRLMALGRLDTATAKSKAGVIVPKALGTAPVRNRLKRQLREIIRHALPVIESASATPPVFVTIARRGSVHATFAELHDEWHRLARKAGLWPAGRPAPPSPGRPAAAVVTRHAS
jgi:ribonuclease P protein component